MTSLMEKSEETESGTSVSPETVQTIAVCGATGLLTVVVGGVCYVLANVSEEVFSHMHYIP